MTQQARAIPSLFRLAWDMRHEYVMVRRPGKWGTPRTARGTEYGTVCCEPNYRWGHV